MSEEFHGDEIFTLTKIEDGNENEFELLGSTEIDGCTYLAFRAGCRETPGGRNMPYLQDGKGRRRDIEATIDDDDELIESPITLKMSCSARSAMTTWTQMRFSQRRRVKNQVTPLCGARVYVLLTHTSKLEPGTAARLADS